jgi:hypothetical protein
VTSPKAPIPDTASERAAAPVVQAAGAPAAAPCANCGDTHAGNFCPQCGQRRATRVVSLRSLIAEVAEDQLSLSGALPRTLGVLLTRPGRLTNDYLAGRIARYVPPFRMYLLASFTFFLLFGFGSSMRSGDGSSTDGQVRTNLEDARILDDTFENVPLLTAAQKEQLRERARRLADMRPGELDRALRDELLARAPIVLFLLLPFAAAVLKLLYIRQRRYYVEHFIFALHLQTFVFILLAVLEVLEPVPFVGGLLVLWLGAYLVLAMKRVYRQSYPSTVVKLGALLAIYGLTFSVSLLALLLFTLLTVPL